MEDFDFMKTEREKALREIAIAKSHASPMMLAATKILIDLNKMEREVSETDDPLVLVIASSSIREANLQVSIIEERNKKPEGIAF